MLRLRTTERGVKMMKVHKYQAMDKTALKQSGWRLFGFVLGLQLLFLLGNYLLQGF